VRQKSFIFIHIYSLSAETTLHEIGDDGGVVPHEGLLGVGGILANLPVRVAERATDSLGEANLLAGLEEVLTREDVLWDKLTKVLGGRNLTGEEGRGEAGTLVHTTTHSIHGGRGGTWGRAGGGTITEGRVLALNDAVLGLVVHGKKEEDQHGDGDQHEDILLTTLHYLLYYYNNFFIGHPRRQRHTRLGKYQGWARGHHGSLTWTTFQVGPKAFLANQIPANSRMTSQVFSGWTVIEINELLL
jgi:hypothetical protein